MGLTQNLGRVSPSVFTDSSLNVGIGAAPSGTYKFEVTGTAKVSGILTLGSTISNGTYTYTLPSATGTLALTSALGDYLPLAGGTLTGALGGTSASFSSTATATAFIPSGATIPSNGMYLSAANTLNFATNTTNRLTITSSGNVGIGTSSPTGKLMLYQSSAGNVIQNIVSNQGGSTQVGISLSPSMTDSEIASNPAQASIYATDYNYGANIIFSNKTTGAVGNSLTERMRISSDGNVGVGTSTTTWRLTAAASSDSLYNVLGVFNTGITGTSAIGKGTTIVLGGNVDGNYSAKIGMVYEGQNPSYLQPALAFYTMNNTYAYGSEVERMRITSGGVVLMNQTTVYGAETLEITSKIVGANQYGILVSGNPASYTNIAMRFHYTGITVVGSITFTTTTTTYGTSSDYRLKKDLKDFNALNVLSNIKIYDFAWKLNDSRMYGVMAHELKEVLPYAVTGEKDELDENGNISPQGVDYSLITPVLVKAIQELSAQNQDLKSRLDKAGL